MQETTVKIVILGDSNVGKSSILHRYMTGVYLESPNTVGARFVGKKVSYEGHSIKLNIWDTAGQERYKSFSKIYCRDAAAVILVYDINDPGSFEGMKKWYELMSENTLPSNTIAFIAANKCDLTILDQTVETTGKDYADYISAEHFCVSAKEGTNVQEMFDRLAERCFYKLLSEKRNSIVLEKNASIRKKKSKCCK
jgi:small GTP-binding protein